MRETQERGALVCRVAPSWIRFGSFEIFYSRNDLESIKVLADYCIDLHFMDIKGEGQYTAFATEVVKRTADMIAGWQAVGIY